MTQPQEAVTVVSSRVVRAGRVDEFRAWTADIDEAVGHFPSHRGNVRLEQPGGVFHLVYQFDTRDQLDRWEASEPFRSLQREGDSFSIARRQVRDGEQVSFNLPGEASASTWKTFVITWAAVLPTIFSLNGLIELLPVDLPQAVRLAITSFLLTATLTWLILPRVKRWTKTWVLSDGDGKVRQADA